MPVSFSVATYSANPVKFYEEGLTGREVLSRTGIGYAASREVVQFSLGQGEECYHDSSTRIPLLLSHRNGLVDTVMTAYVNHHALVIRPDDIWLTILCQFNFFVNANAELLRANFVAHDGKHNLLVESLTFDCGAMARQMAGLLEKTVIDPTLRKWAIPTFTTTTLNNTTVSAVLLMSTLKKYFSLGFLVTGCGIPRVTIEGEKSDWEDILGRLEKLKEYGIETITWYHLLRPVIARIIAAFDAPESRENIDFWSEVAHRDQRSGYCYYSGWINAFNAFSREGVWLGHKSDTTITSKDAPESLSAETFWATYSEVIRKELMYDGTPYHRLNQKLVPPGCAEVDVTLEDTDGNKFDCSMLAGMAGSKVSSSADKALSGTGENDTVQPLPGWWMLGKKQVQKGHSESNASDAVDAPCRPLAASVIDTPKV
ncbi:hypothetical protein C8F04DRAFT_1323817 [Mycena alexandri]|uniref:Uncharacterized protein n=1 Tax=Mycena alexandri TaxID=1745969 RepID=A0AAD6X804_9AGAR|nr:hypothetical protein C8F04DRAFT_1323817 [Mycena alexandri]